MGFLDMFSTDIAVDLGTANTLIYIKGKGIVLNEPSIVAFDRNTKKIIEIGNKAKEMLGREHREIRVTRPMRDGVIADFEIAEGMIRAFIKKVAPNSISSKRIVIAVPSGVTEVEKRSVIEVTEEAGARHTALIEEPMAAAIGAGLDISAPNGNMVIDIGGGTSDVAIISLGGIVISDSAKVAGDKFDESLIRYMKKKHNILIGERTAEEIKINIGSAFPRKEQIYMEVSGRNLISGLPKTVTLSSNETIEAFEEPLNALMELLHGVLERVPPELSSDIADGGICMTGGGSLLYGLDRMLSEKTGIPCYVAEDAISCVAIGTGLALDNIDLYSNGTVYDYRRGDYYENY